MPKPKSDKLFHFTKNIDFLKSILSNGFLPRYCLEDTKWFSPINDFLAYPMICFCDIPISRVSDHTASYGEYGIGLTKEWGLTNRLTPIIYTSTDSSITQVVDFLMGIDYPEDSERANKRNIVATQITKIISLIKPITGQMRIAGKIVEKQFNQENEWRYVPQSFRILNEKEFQLEKDDYNERMKEYKLAISPNDIRYIFVQKDSEIPDLVDFIDTHLRHFSEKELKLLTTRILSLETIAIDL